MGCSLFDIAALGYYSNSLITLFPFNIGSQHSHLCSCPVGTADQDSTKHMFDMSPSRNEDAVSCLMSIRGVGVPSI